MYYDLVKVRIDGEERVFRAPAWSSLHEGDEVKVDTERSCNAAKVLDVITLEEGGSQDKFIKKLIGVEHFKKVLGVVIFTEYKYPEDIFEDISDEQEEESCQE